MRPKAAAAALAALLAGAACSLAGPAPSVHAELGRQFSLASGESVRVRGENLRIGFDGVTADSRCPKGEQCIWAGDATVRVWLQQGAAPRQDRELHAATGAAQSAHVAGLELRLVRLDPYPVMGRAIAKQAYVATLLLSRKPPDAGDNEK